MRSETVDKTVDKALLVADVLRGMRRNVRLRRWSAGAEAIPLHTSHPGLSWVRM